MWRPARAEQRNYCDPAGFRAQMSRVMNRKVLWVVGLTLIPMVAMTSMLMSWLGANITNAILALYLIVIFGSFWMTQHNRFQNDLMIWYAMVTGGVVLLATGLISQETLALITVASFVWLMRVAARAPRRMDASLFFRAGLGMLEIRTTLPLREFQHPGWTNAT